MTVQTRRKFDRYHCEMIVWLRPRATDEEFLLVDVENISSGGLLVHATHDWPLGTILELQISLLHQPELIAVTAKVAHCRLEAEEDWRIGLELVETPQLNPQSFAAWLEAMFN